MRTVSRVYDDYADAVAVVTDLEAATDLVPNRKISMIANENAHGRDTTEDTTRTETKSEAGPGAGIGALVGGGVGLLTGLGLLAIPGVGPLVAAGWLATTLAGAATGAAAGGIVGALVKSGVPHEEAEVYEEGVRRGGTLVSVQAEDVDVPKVEAIFDRRTTADWRTRREQYATSGWQPSARHNVSA
jgi:hypothetical protein